MALVRHLADPLIETPRLRLRRFTPDDAAFILALLNDPEWLRYIGDKGVRNLDDAGRYLADGPLASYARFGFGLLRVESAATGEPIGTCGVLKRDELPDPDVGFAFLPAFRGHGYAREALAAVLADARVRLRLPRLLAITSPENERSIAVLEEAGFRSVVTTALSEGAAPVRIFALAF